MRLTTKRRFAVTAMQDLVNEQLAKDGNVTVLMDRCPAGARKVVSVAGLSRQFPANRFSTPSRPA